MEFSVKVPDGKGGEIPLWRAIPEWAGTSREITATGRRWGEGDYFGDYKGCHALFSQDKQQIPLPHQMTPKKRVKYYVGQTRAIQPSRTGAGVGYRKQMAGAATVYQYAHELQFEHTAESYATADKGWLLNMGFHPARIRILSLEKIRIVRMTDQQAQRTGFNHSIAYGDWWLRQYGGDADYMVYIGFEFITQ